MLTWVVMPRLTRVLYRWLYADCIAAGNSVYAGSIVSIPNANATCDPTSAHPRGQWRARWHGIVGIYGNRGNVDSVTYRF
jgi:hypothetical protein